MHRGGVIGFCLCLAGTMASAGEILFIDPAREKAQSLPQAPLAPRHDEARGRALDDARSRSGREVAPFIDYEPTSSPARDARSQLDDQAVVPAPTLILKTGPSPSEAAQAREKARAWVPPAANSSSNRCRTENTVGSIEGMPQGTKVIQSTTGGVSTLCK